MKALLFVSLIFFGNFPTPIHDVPLAKFHIKASDDIIEMDIIFDLEDFTESLEIRTTDVNLESVQNYIAKNTSFQFNAQVANLKISEVKIIRNHLKVKGDFGESKMIIKNIEIENRCLINIPNHSNVIQIDLNNKSKDYRMHKKRTVINLKY